MYRQSPPAGTASTVNRAQPLPASGRADLRAADFARAPFIVIWELTRACGLACVHCRAEAVARRDPRELTTEEGLRLIDAVAGFGSPAPLLVLTGGDPLRRPDVYDLVAAGTQRGLRVALTPSGTASARREKIHRLKTAGLARLAVSLDGSTAAIHDAFRRVRGSYDWTMRILDDARDAGLTLQINTTVTKHNRSDLPDLAERLVGLKIVLWSVFFLVPTGRGRAEDGVSAQDYEEVLNDLYDLSSVVPFGIKTTEAPHYRRIVEERGRGVRRDGRTDRHRSITTLAMTLQRSPDKMGRPEQFGFRMDTIGRASAGVNDGNGFVFVDHVGDITPSGFLPLRTGSVRTESLIDVYRGHPLFRALRSPDGFRGRCGACEFRTVCGGSRGRAYAMTGDCLGEDPCCLYEPGSAEPA